MFASGNSKLPHGHASMHGQTRKPLSAMQIMLIILGLLVLATALLNAASNGLRKTQKEQAATYPVQPEVSAKADAIAFYQQVRNVTGPCDFAGGVRAIAMTGGDPVSTYQAATKEDTSCIEVSERLRDLKIPQSVGRQVAIAFANGLDKCDGAYVFQWSAAHALANALNNGGKMEDVAKFKESDTLSKGEGSSCYDELIAAPATLGVASDDLHGPSTSNDQPPATEAQSTAPTQPMIGSYPMPYLKYAPATVQRMLSRWAQLNDECQGDDRNLGVVCPARDRAGWKLERAGWCYGGPNDYEADRVWKPCSLVGKDEPQAR